MARAFRVLLITVWCHAAIAFDVMRHLATSTPYQPKTGRDVAPAAPGACKLHQVNMVLRHGTRHPTLSTIEMAADFNQRLQIALTEKPDVPSWLRGWRPRFDRVLSGELTTTGMLEHYHLAKRLAIRYPEVFAQPYLEPRCRLRSTQKSRAGRSASAFAIGLWHGTGEVTEHRFEPTFIYTTGPLDNDPILRPFDRCPLYEWISEDPESNRHYREYMAPVAQRIAARIEKRLGISLDSALIAPAWKILKAELSALGDSNLTMLFDETDVLDLELGDDIATYWRKGPGHPVNWQMLCPLLHDILISITGAANDVQDGLHRHLDLRFAHAETLIPFVTSLGLFQDKTVLTSNSIASELHLRSWRMSHVSPYAANVAFHLYQCEDQFKVSILHNEDRVPITFCSGQYFCPLDTFEKHLLDLTSRCNLTEICSLDNMSDTCKATDEARSGKQSARLLALFATTIGLSFGTIAGFLIYRRNHYVREMPDLRDFAYERLRN